MLNVQRNRQKRFPKDHTIIPFLCLNYALAQPLPSSLELPNHERLGAKSALSSHPCSSVCVWKPAFVTVQHPQGNRVDLRLIRKGLTHPHQSHNNWSQHYVLKIPWPPFPVVGLHSPWQKSLGLLLIPSSGDSKSPRSAQPRICSPAASFSCPPPSPILQVPARSTTFRTACLTISVPGALPPINSKKASPGATSLRLSKHRRFAFYWTSSMESLLVCVKHKARVKRTQVERPLS